MVSTLRAAFAAAILLPATASLAAETAGAGPQAGSASWSWSLSATQYWLPKEPDFLLGVATADRGALHLETRWQYEDLRSVSILAGWKFAFGDALRVEATPLLGPVFGRSTGIVPGLELDLGWHWLNFYTEDELLIGLNDSTESYLYSWTELTAKPFDVLTLGVVVQRTRLVRSPLEVQGGLLGRLSYGGITLGVSVFNPVTPNWYVSTGLSVAR